MLQAFVFLEGNYFLSLIRPYFIIELNKLTCLFLCRPPWNVGMTVDELDVNENQAFLAWRRSLAK